VTTWTDSDGEIHKYPTLIFHEEQFTLPITLDFYDILVDIAF